MGTIRGAITAPIPIGVLVADVSEAMLESEDADAFDFPALELLNPWTIEGRYPADLPDDAELDEVLAAARRVVDAARKSGE